MIWLCVLAFAVATGAFVVAGGTLILLLQIANGLNAIAAHRPAAARHRAHG